MKFKPTPQEDEPQDGIIAFLDNDNIAPMFVSFTEDNGNEQGIAYAYIERIEHKPKRGKITINTRKEVVVITGTTLHLLYRLIITRQLLTVEQGEQEGIVVSSIQIQNKRT